MNRIVLTVLYFLDELILKHIKNFALGFVRGIFSLLSLLVVVAALMFLLFSVGSITVYVYSL
jgi:hypothetical protein